MKRVLFSMIPLFSLVALAGCGGGGQDAKPDLGQQGHSIKRTDTAGPDVEQDMNCPQVAVLGEAQTVTLFLPGRADVAAQVSTAQITGVSGACVENEEKHTVEVTVNASFLAGNGPANKGAKVKLPWFASIAQGDSIVDKETYDITFDFNGNMSTAAASTAKPLKFEFPDTAATQQMQVLIGFQMTPDQLAYAAAHPGASPYLP